MFFPFGFNKYPHTDFQTLNLDWLISAVKKCLEICENVNAKITDALKKAEAALTAGKHAEDLAGQANTTAANANVAAKAASKNATEAKAAATTAQSTANSAKNSADAAQNVANGAAATATSALDKINKYQVPLATSSKIGGILADSAQVGDTQPVRIKDGRLYTAPSGGGGGGGYTLPVASSNILGGIKADIANPQDTIPVHIGTDNKLYSAPPETPKIPEATIDTLGGVKLSATDPGGFGWTSIFKDGAGKIYAKIEALAIATAEKLGGVKPENKTTGDTQPVRIDSNGKLWTAPPKSYTLPIAAANKLGGVKPDNKTAGDTQPVHVDSSGKLWTAPSGSGFKIKWQTTDTFTEFGKSFKIPISLSQGDIIYISAEWKYYGNYCTRINGVYIVGTQPTESFYFFKNSPIVVYGGSYNGKIVGFGEAFIKEETSQISIRGFDLNNAARNSTEASIYVLSI